MTPRPSSSCEGRCGVTLYWFAKGWWETAPGPGGGRIPGWELEQRGLPTDTDDCWRVRVDDEHIVLYADIDTVAGDV